MKRIENYLADSRKCTDLAKAKSEALANKFII